MDLTLLGPSEKCRVYVGACIFPVLVRFMLVVYCAVASLCTTEAGLQCPQKRAGARLRSRSSSGQADKIAVVFMVENSCDVPTTRPVRGSLTAFCKKMQPQ